MTLHAASSAEFSHSACHTPLNILWDSAGAIETVGSTGSEAEDIADVLSEGLPLTVVVGCDSISDVMVDVNSVDKDVLANLEENFPAALLMEQFDELFGFRLGFTFSTFAILQVIAELSSNGGDLFDSSNVLLALEVANSGLDLSDESLDISEALQWQVNTADGTL